VSGAEVDADPVRLALPAANAQPTSGSCAEIQQGSLAERVASFEKTTVVAEIRRQHRNITKAAAALGLERSHLYKKCQQLGIDLRAMCRASDSPVAVPTPAKLNAKQRNFPDAPSLQR
jgi:two-component system, NtrC family, nitrogen regulation response regulator NtrX